jgi:hypothetical protein
MLVERIQIVRTVRLSENITDIAEICEILDILSSAKIPVDIQTYTREFLGSVILKSTGKRITLMHQGGQGKEDVVNDDIIHIKVVTDDEIRMPWSYSNRSKNLEL